jgi:hypothetical protein
MPDSSTPPDPESDSEVFDSPAAKARTARSRAKSATIAASLRPSLSASATVTAPVTSRPRTRGALLAEVVIPVNAKKRVLAASKGDKENAAPPPVTRLGAARGMRRTVSVPA